MKKLVFLLCLLFLFTGCKQSTDLSFLANAFENQPHLRVNNRTLYFDYYASSDLKEITFKNTGVVFEYLDYPLVLNLNIFEIIKEEADGELYDDGFFVKEELLDKYEGVYKDYRGDEKQYSFEVYQKEELYLLHLKTSDVNVYAQAGNDSLALMADKMCFLAQNLLVNTAYVDRDFSNENLIDYERQQVDLFESIIAPDGYLSEIVRE